MLELAVTAACCIQIPTIVVEHSQHLGDPHCASISSVEPSGKVSLWPNVQVERRAATDVAEQEVAYRRVRSNAGLGLRPPIHAPTRPPRNYRPQLARSTENCMTKLFCES
jgi:hypothetical protein